MRPAARRAGTDAAAAFRSAVSQLEAGMDQQRRVRPEVAFENQPPPRKLAPYAAAVGATVHEPRAGRGARPAAAPDEDTEVGWGSFVLLYDPAGQSGWAGPLRIIAYVRADLEPEMEADPLIGRVGWSWLTEALEARTTGYRQISGTVTRVVTEGFGAKQGEPVATGFELRASWSPAPAGPAGSGADAPRRGAAAGPPDRAVRDLDGHIAAWCETLCAASGLPPLPAGVSALRPSRRRP